MCRTCRRWAITQNATAATLVSKQQQQVMVSPAELLLSSTMLIQLYYIPICYFLLLHHEHYYFLPTTLTTGSNKEGKAMDVVDRDHYQKCTWIHICTHQHCPSLRLPLPLGSVQKVPMSVYDGAASKAYQRLDLFNGTSQTERKKVELFNCFFESQAAVRLVLDECYASTA